MEKLFNSIEENKTGYYEKMLREEKELLEDIRQRKLKIAAGDFDSLNYYLWNYKDADSSDLRQWVENAERLELAFERLIGRDTTGPERKAVCELSKIESGLFSEIERLLKEIETGESGGRLAAVSGSFDPQVYFTGYKIKLPSDLLRQAVERAEKLMETAGGLLNRRLEEQENLAVCEAALLDPESVRDVQGMLDEIARIRK